MTVEKQDVIDALKKIYDPEIPVNIWDMGLIYNIDIADDAITIQMTFTSPTCPMMEELLMQVQDGVSAISGGKPVRIERKVAKCSTTIFTNDWMFDCEFKTITSLLSSS